MIWVEANPNIFDDLQINISEFKHQIAFNATLHSTTGKKTDFYLSTNDGASSSIYDFSEDYKNKKIHFENKSKKYLYGKKNKFDNKYFG